VNRLKIKYFNNLLDFAKCDKEFMQNSGHKYLHEYKGEQLKSFMEYEIDGELLITKFWKGNQRGFLGFNVGLLGLINRAYDDLMIKYFLKVKISKSDILNIYERYKVKVSSTQIDNLVKEFEKDELVIYACKACLDCTKVRLNIESDNNQYSWSISPEHKYTFQKEEYELEFTSYRTKLQENRFNEIESMNLYQFK